MVSRYKSLRRLRLDVSSTKSGKMVAAKSSEVCKEPSETNGAPSSGRKPGSPPQVMSESTSLAEDKSVKLQRQPEEVLITSCFSYHPLDF